MCKWSRGVPYSKELGQEDPLATRVFLTGLNVSTSRVTTLPPQLLLLTLRDYGLYSYTDPQTRRVLFRSLHYEELFSDFSPTFLRSVLLRKLLGVFSMEGWSALYLDGPPFYSDVRPLFEVATSARAWILNARARKRLSLCSTYHLHEIIIGYIRVATAG